MSFPTPPWTNGQVWINNNITYIYESSINRWKKKSIIVDNIPAFQNNPTNIVDYELTNSLSAAFTAPSTSGLRYLITSIRLTNISANVVTYTGEIDTTGAINISLGDQIIIPIGASIDILLKPKILLPSGIINLQCSANSSLHASINYTILYDTTYFINGADITTTSITTLYTCSNSNGDLIGSIFVANDTSSTQYITITRTDGSNTVLGYISYKIPVYKNSIIELLNNILFIENGHKIRYKAEAANGLEILLTGKNI